MATSVIDDLWTNADKVNWFKGVGVMEITDEAIRPFVETEITKFHFDIKSNFRHGSLCGTCRSTNASYCSLRICSDITSQIESVHRYSPPCYTNSDIAQWLSDPWEIAKCYMSRSKDLEGKPGSDIDFPSILNVVINNKRFQRLVTAVDMTNNNNIFCKGRNARNEVMHSRSPQMTALDLNHYCDIFIDIVNNIGTDKAECVGKIEKVRDTPLSITAEDIFKLKEQAARYQGLAELEIEELKMKWREEIKKGKSLIPSFIDGFKESLCRLTKEHIQRQKPERTIDDWTVEKFLLIMEALPQTKDLSESHREILFPSSGSHVELAQWDIYLYCFVLNIKIHHPLDKRTLLFMKDAKTLRDTFLANPSVVEKSELLNLCDYLDNPLKDDMLRIFEREHTFVDMIYANIVLQSWRRDEDRANEANYRSSHSKKDELLFKVILSLFTRQSQIEKDIASGRKESVEMPDDVATGEATGSYETEAELKPYNALQADIEELQKMMTSPDQNNCVVNRNGATDYFTNKTDCTINKFVEGSIILKVVCPSMETLFGFWKGCTDGTVVEAMSKIRDAYREHLGCDTLEFDIVLKKKEVTRCTNIIIEDLNSRLERLEKQTADVDDPISKPVGDLNSRLERLEKQTADVDDPISKPVGDLNSRLERLEKQTADVDDPISKPVANLNSRLERLEKQTADVDDPISKPVGDLNSRLERLEKQTADVDDPISKPETRTKEAVEAENKTILEDIIRYCRRKDYKKHNVLLIGRAGSGKSSVINNMLKIIIGEFLPRAQAGSGNVPSNTLRLGRYPRCASKMEDFPDEKMNTKVDSLPEELFKTIWEHLPDLFDAAAMENKNDEKTKQILRLLIGGYIDPGTDIAELEKIQADKDLSYLPLRYCVPYDQYKMSMIVFACSCVSPIPYELIKCVREVLQEDDPNTLHKRYDSNVYLLITKYDRVGRTDSADEDESSIEVIETSNVEETITVDQYKTVENQLAEAFIIKGMTSKCSLRWVSYNEAVGFNTNPYIDNNSLKLLKYLTTPHQTEAGPRPGPGPGPGPEPWTLWFRKIKADMLFTLHKLNGQNVQFNIPLIVSVCVVILAMIVWMMSGTLRKSGLFESKVMREKAT